MAANFMDFFNDNALAVLLPELGRNLDKQRRWKTKLLNTLRLRDFRQRMFQAHLTGILLEQLPDGPRRLRRICFLLV